MVRFGFKDFTGASLESCEFYVLSLRNSYLVLIKIFILNLIYN